MVFEQEEGRGKEDLKSREKVRVGYHLKTREKGKRFSRYTGNRRPSRGKEDVRETHEGTARGLPIARISGPFFEQSAKKGTRSVTHTHTRARQIETRSVVCYELQRERES